LRLVLKRLFPHPRVRRRPPLAFVRLRHKRGHQLAVADRPLGGPAHRLVGDPLHRLAVEVGAVLDQLDDVEYRLTRDRPNEREQSPRTQTVAAIEDRETHARSYSVQPPGPRAPLRTSRSPGRSRPTPLSRRSGPR